MHNAENVNWHVCGLQILLQFVSQWKCGLLFWWILWSDLLNDWWSKVKILFFKTNAKQHNRLRLVLGPGMVNIWHFLFKYPIPCKKVLNSSSWSWTTVKCPFVHLCITPVREQLAFSLIKRAQIPKHQYAKMILKLKKCASRVQNHWFCLILGSCVPISCLI